MDNSNAGRKKATLRQPYMSNSMNFRKALLVS